MKSIIAAIYEALFPKKWIVTLSDDYGQTLRHTIRAHSYRAALREADALTDSDWYSVTVHLSSLP